MVTATRNDLARAAELTQRTHQLNTTGLVFSPGELAVLMESADHALLTASLEDRFGSYGTVGIVLLGRHPGEWRIRLLLMSCRVMGRNVGGAVLAYLARAADGRARRLTADYLPNPVNRPMYVVYRLAGFSEDGCEGGVTRLSLAAAAPRQWSAYVDLAAPDLPLYLDNFSSLGTSPPDN